MFPLIKTSPSFQQVLTVPRSWPKASRTSSYQHVPTAADRLRPVDRRPSRHSKMLIAYLVLMT